MGSHLALPVAQRARTGSSAGQLCLNQDGYYLHELRRGQLPGANDLVVKHLRTPDEIASVQHLRGQIDLSHSVGDPRFHTDEKKETNWVSPSDLSSMASLSARYAPFHSVTVSH